MKLERPGLLACSFGYTWTFFSDVHQGVPKAAELVVWGNQEQKHQWKWNDSHNLLPKRACQLHEMQNHGNSTPSQAWGLHIEGQKGSPGWDVLWSPNRVITFLSKWSVDLLRNRAELFHFLHGRWFSTALWPQELGILRKVLTVSGFYVLALCTCTAPLSAINISG